MLKPPTAGAAPAHPHLSVFLKKGWLLDFSVVGELTIISHIHNCAHSELRQVMPILRSFMVNEGEVYSDIRDRENWKNFRQYVLDPTYPLFFVNNIDRGITDLDKRLGVQLSDPIRIQAFQELERELVERLREYEKTRTFHPMSSTLYGRLFAISRLPNKAA